MVWMRVSQRPSGGAGVEGARCRRSRVGVADRENDAAFRGRFSLNTNYHDWKRLLGSAPILILLGILDRVIDQVMG